MDPAPPATAEHTRAASTGRRIALADQLNDEWGRLTESRAVLRSAAAWSLDVPPFDHLDRLLWHAGYRRPTADDDGDRVLAELVRLATDDRLAARVVIQRILPGLISIAVRRGRIVPEGAAGAFADVVSSAWQTVREYPIERRPWRVAANLLRDIEYQAFVRSNRRRAQDVQVGDVEGALGARAGCEDDTDPGARREWHELLVWARRRGVEAAQVELLAQLAQGRSSAELASSMRCSERTVRNRRDAAMAAVRLAYEAVAA